MKLSVSVWVAIAVLLLSACNRSGAAPEAMNNAEPQQSAAVQTAAAPPSALTQVQTGGVVINGYRLTPQELAQFGGGIPPGDYWYDGVAGFWGYVGGPVQGQVTPGYRIGALRQDASAGNTGTIINGREIPLVEAAWLARQVPVQRGRFWMNAQGVFGYEGGGPLGQIALGGQGSGGGGARPSLSERGMLFRPGEILLGR